MLKEKLISCIYSFFRLLPVKKNTVLLFSYYGEQYSGSPKYIGEYLYNNSDMNVVWAFVKPEKHQNVKGNSIRYGHIQYYYMLATAGTVVTNYRMMPGFKRRANQKYIQTWHSSLRLKQIEKDAEKTLPEHYIVMAKKDSRQISHLLAGSGKSEEIFRRAFWYDGKIEKTGTPQCDVLFQDRERLREKVCKYYNFPKGARIAMYAPTFRKSHDISVYDLDHNRLLEALSNKYGGEWFLLMRLHPHLIDSTDCFHYTDHVISATEYDDVQELLASADFLITDYSAIMFDYCVTKKPCFLYVPDLESYTSKDRNLYFNIDDLPFPSYTLHKDLLSGIASFNEEKYTKKIETFLQKIDSYDDGKSCERVYRIIRGEKTDGSCWVYDRSI